MWNEEWWMGNWECGIGNGACFLEDHVFKGSCPENLQDLQDLQDLHDLQDLQNHNNPKIKINKCVLGRPWTKWMIFMVIWRCLGSLWDLLRIRRGVEHIKYKCFPSLPWNSMKMVAIATQSPLPVWKTFLTIVGAGSNHMNFFELGQESISRPQHWQHM